MTQQLTTQPAAEDKLSVWLARDDSKRTIAAALGGYLELEEFLAHLMIHIQTTPATKWAPALAECTLASQYKSIHICATLGLLPNFQQVALIPRKNGNLWELTVMPQWQGFKALFERVPEVLEARVAAVHKSDVFEVTGDGMDIVVSRHEFNPLDPGRTIAGPADILGTYCRFSFRDGRPDRYHFAPTHYIQKCRGCAGTDVIWEKWFEQMALKTAFRSAYSRRIVPIDPMVQGKVEAFLAHEDAMLGNDPRIIDASVQPAKMPPVSRAAMIAQQMRPQVTQASEMPEPGGSGQEPVASDPPEQEQGPEPQEEQAGPEQRETAQREPAEPAGEKTNIERFRLMMASATSDAMLSRLEESWTGKDSQEQLTDVERTAIRHIVESERSRRHKEKTGGKDKQKRLGE